MKITCQECGTAFEASEDDVGKWLVCRRCEAPVWVDRIVDLAELGMAPATRDPVPVIQVQDGSQQQTPRQPSQRDPPVRIEPIPRRRRSGSSTYKPRKRVAEIGIVGLIASGFFFAASILPSLTPEPPAPRPPAPLVSEEEMERLEGLLSDQTIETASERYDEAAYEKWKARAGADTGADFSQ